jgi:hypothetical protein
MVSYPSHSIPSTFSLANVLPLDFCLWAPIEPNSVVGDVEGEMVAWCTKPGRGTRVIPANSLQGVQFMKTPDYVQVVGFIDQTKINIQAGDSGGEMDPHGADLVRSYPPHSKPFHLTFLAILAAWKPTRRTPLLEFMGRELQAGDRMAQVRPPSLTPAASPANVYPPLTQLHWQQLLLPQSL